MLCNKHQIEECNSSDCESCKLEAENKKILRMHGVNEAFEQLEAENIKLRKYAASKDDGFAIKAKLDKDKTKKLKTAIQKIDTEVLKTWEFLMRENNPNATSFLKIHKDLQKILESK